MYVRVMMSAARTPNALEMYNRTPAAVGHIPLSSLKTPETTKASSPPMRIASHALDPAANVATETTPMKLMAAKARPADVAVAVTVPTERLRWCGW